MKTIWIVYYRRGLDEYEPLVAYTSRASAEFLVKILGKIAVGEVMLKEIPLEDPSGQEPR